MITVGSAPIITHCSQRLTSSFETSWVKASDEDAGVLARAIVRLAMSYVSMPPEADHDVADDLALLMTPFAERYGVIEMVELRYEDLLTTEVHRGCRGRVRCGR